MNSKALSKLGWILAAIIIVVIAIVAFFAWGIYKGVTPDDTSPNTQFCGEFPCEQLNCEEDTYNCDDFETRQKAQNIFDSCGGTENDIHRLDNDGDGIVCESLPSG